jgi:hypothetical protein
MSRTVQLSLMARGEIMPGVEHTSHPTVPVCQDWHSCCEYQPQHTCPSISAPRIEFWHFLTTGSPLFADAWGWSDARRGDGRGVAGLRELGPVAVVGGWIKGGAVSEQPLQAPPASTPGVWVCDAWQSTVMQLGVCPPCPAVQAPHWTLTVFSTTCWLSGRF